MGVTSSQIDAPEDTFDMGIKSFSPTSTTKDSFTNAQTFDGMATPTSAQRSTLEPRRKKRKVRVLSREHKQLSPNQTNDTELEAPSSKRQKIYARKSSFEWQPAPVSEQPAVEESAKPPRKVLHFARKSKFAWQPADLSPGEKDLRTSMAASAPAPVPAASSKRLAEDVNNVQPPIRTLQFAKKSGFDWTPAAIGHIEREAALTVVTPQALSPPDHSTDEQPLFSDALEIQTQTAQDEAEENMRCMTSTEIPLESYDHRQPAVVEEKEQASESEHSTGLSPAGYTDSQQALGGNVTQSDQSVNVLQSSCDDSHQDMDIDDVLGQGEIDEREDASASEASSAQQSRGSPRSQRLKPTPSKGKLKSPASISSSHAVLARPRKRTDMDRQTTLAPPPERSSTSQTKLSRDANGAFTAEERQIVEDIVEATVDGSLTREELKKAIQEDWRSLAVFKSRLETALPWRSKPSIRKFCKRAYHASNRGPWSSEEEESLKTAMAAHGQHWTKVSEVVGRRAEDCYDHWRTALPGLMIKTKAQGADVTFEVAEKPMVIGPWSLDEETRLQTIVDEFLETTSSPEQLNWRLVSERFETRSAKSCREKYTALQKRRLRPSQIQVSKKSELSRSQKQRKAWAELQVKSFGLGDHYDVLIEIRESIDPNKVYEHDSTVWSIVAQQNAGSRFKTIVRKASFEHSLKRLDQAVTGQTIAQLAMSMVEDMEERYGLRKLEASRRYTAPTTSTQATRASASQTKLPWKGKASELSEVIVREETPLPADGSPDLELEVAPVKAISDEDEADLEEDASGDEQETVVPATQQNGRRWLFFG